MPISEVGQRRAGSVAAVLALVLVAACRTVSPPSSVEPPEAGAVRAARAAQNAAIVAGDFDRMASYWTEDVSIRRALGVQVNGREAYRQIFAGDPNAIYQRHPTHVEIASPWPLAFETGEWEGHAGPLDSPVVIAGRYSAQWVKRDGRWLIRAEVYVPLSCAGAGCSWKAVP